MAGLKYLKLPVPNPFDKGPRLWVLDLEMKFVELLQLISGEKNSACYMDVSKNRGFYTPNHPF